MPVDANLTSPGALPGARPGAPPPGLDYLDWLQACGALRCAACSFPRMGGAAGGLATTSQGAARHVPVQEQQLLVHVAARAALRIIATCLRPHPTVCTAELKWLLIHLAVLFLLLLPSHQASGAATRCCTPSAARAA
jgi:hypothetical protein